MQKQDRTPSPVARVLLTTAGEDAPPPRRTALVIDDTGCHRHIAISLLKRLGFDVEQAIDGLQGLEMMIEKRFDVVFCDYEMPGLDGFACVSELRQWEHDHRPHHQKQPVVCFTASLQQQSGIAAQGLEAGMDMVVPKPYSRGKLETALEQVQML